MTFPHSPQLRNIHRYFLYCFYLHERDVSNISDLSIWDNEPSTNASIVFNGYTVIDKLYLLCKEFTFNEVTHLGIIVVHCNLLAIHNPISHVTEKNIQQITVNKTTFLHKLAIKLMSFLNCKWSHSTSLRKPSLLGSVCIVSTTWWSDRSFSLVSFSNARASSMAELKENSVHGELILTGNRAENRIEMEELFGLA